jgi:DNA invertase Pin-like site-specific DNA recombinase
VVAFARAAFEYKPVGSGRSDTNDRMVTCCHFDPIYRWCERGDVTKRNIESGGLIPAAQYIRMSTEHQRFSPDSQRAANLAYAAKHGFEIIATYQDSGKSGLTLKKRPELKRLLADVLGGQMPYRAILVLDVSRWGRFQDADQAAHYEYMCREAGVPVRYCSEAFDNDGGAMASIVKHMKRVMAAEYSRELSKKVARAQRHQASLGYKQGGNAVFATRRLVIDENGKPRMFLETGQCKALSTDKVVYERGIPSEVALVRRMFRMYALEGYEIAEISKWLNKKGKTQRGGRPWIPSTISHILHNEIYIGTYVFGRNSNNLGKQKSLPPSQWVRSCVMAPIVQPDLFEAARQRLARASRRYWSDEELKTGLKRLLREQGFISGPIIDACPYLPRQNLFIRRFGTLGKACEIIGYEKPPRASKAHVRRYTDQQLLEMLRRIYEVNGRLTHSIINADRRSPKAAYFVRRLGGLRNAYFIAGIPQGRMPQERADLNPDGSPMTEETLLNGLRALLAKRGFLSKKIIDEEPSIPCSSFFGQKFDGLISAYASIGYFSTRREIMQATYARRAALDVE